MMMIPEAYPDRTDLSDDLKGFYAFHSCLMEPWDGPASWLSPTAACRRDARPQRSAPGPLGAHDRRLVASGLRDRRAAGRAAEIVERLACARASCSSSTSRRRIVDGRRGQAQLARPAALTATLVRPNVMPFRRPADRTRQTELAHPAGRALQRAFGYTRRTCGCSSRRWRPTGAEADRLDGQRRRARRALKRQPPLFSVLQTALRAGHQPADRPDPRVVVMSSARRRRRTGNLLERRPSTPTSS